MSVVVSSLVWKHYPSRDTDFVLALALADYAQHDGSDVYPSVETLTEDVGKSRRMIQLLLAKMRNSGFLVVVGNAQGGRSNTVRYSIDLEWLKRAPQIARFTERKARNASAPFTPEKGCNGDDERVQFSALKGATAVAPDPLNHQEPSTERSALEEDSPTQATGSTSKAATKRQASCTLATYIEACGRQGTEPIPATAPVFALAARKGIPTDFVELAWLEFKRNHLPGGRRAATKQHDWPATFRNAVDGEWGKLWWCKPDHSFELTSAGRQAMNLHHGHAA